VHGPYIARFAVIGEYKKKGRKTTKQQEKRKQVCWYCFLPWLKENTPSRRREAKYCGPLHSTSNFYFAKKGNNYFRQILFKFYLLLCA